MPWHADCFNYVWVSGRFPSLSLSTVFPRDYPVSFRYVCCCGRPAAKSRPVDFWMSAVRLHACKHPFNNNFRCSSVSIACFRHTNETMNEGGKEGGEYRPNGTRWRNFSRKQRYFADTNAFFKKFARFERFGCFLFHLAFSSDIFLCDVRKKINSNQTLRLWNLFGRNYVNIWIIHHEWTYFSSYY